MFLTPWTDLHREMNRFANEAWRPACEIDERGDHYAVTLDVPGVPRERIQIDAQEGELIISGERTFERREDSEGRWYSERRSGKFERRFALPEGVDLDRIEASLADGQLVLRVPKPAAAKSRRIPVSGAAEAGSGQLSSPGLMGRLLGKKSGATDEGAA